MPKRRPSFIDDSCHSRCEPIKPTSDGQPLLKCRTIAEGAAIIVPRA